MNVYNFTGSLEVEMQDQQPPPSIPPPHSDRIPVGSTVRVCQVPPYLKTADPMPMLRPATLVQLGELGHVLDQKPKGYYSVQFANGRFLIDHRYLERQTSP